MKRDDSHPVCPGLPRAWRMVPAVCCALGLLGGAPAFAQPTDLDSASYASGSTLVIDSTGTLKNPKTLPDAMTFQAPSTGTTIYLDANSPTSYGRWNTAAGGATTLNLTGGNFTFANGKVTGSGGAFSSTAADLVIAPAAGVLLTLTGNTASTSGGAINVNPGQVHINGALTASGNTTTGGVGGAVYGFTGVTVTGNATLTGNRATGGGAIYTAGGDVQIGGDLLAEDNTATGGGGGAISATGNVTVTGNATLNRNASNALGGGAIYAAGLVQIVGNLEADGNTADIGTEYGGVIHALGGIIVNGSASLTNNHAHNFGGALYTTGNVQIDGDLLADHDGGTQGGAIIAGGKVTVSGDGVLTNDTSNFGGSIYAAGATLGHDGGSWTISDNTSGNQGGAVFSASSISALSPALTLTFNGGLTATGNKATGRGGAFYVEGSAVLNAVGGNMVFSGNLENTGSAAQANAIYMSNIAGVSQLTLNAAAGQTITFSDPIQSAANKKPLPVTVTGGGVVVFDGLLHGGNPADQWSQLNGATTVTGGATFAVQNNAVYGMLAAETTQTSPTSFTVDGGATLAGGTTGQVRADEFTLGGALDIAGSASPGSASGGFSAFSVMSGNVNFSGGTIEFNTYLNDAGAQLTDVLTLDLNGGAITGSATIHVNNVGGPGAQTTGNGILAVQVLNAPASMSDDTFVLKGGSIPTPSGYAYKLVRGGVDPGDTANKDNWFLRSSASPIPPATAAAIPALDGRALALLALLLAGLGIAGLPRRRPLG